MVSSGGERSPSPAKPEPTKDDAPPPSSAGAPPPAERKRSRTPERRRTRSRSRSHSRGRRHYDSRSRSRSRSPQRRRSRTRSPRSRSRSHSPENDDGLRLHVADLDNNASKRDLERLFGKYGPLKEIWMARSTPCFAFVVYRYREDAAEACRYTDGVDVCGRRVRVTVAKPRTRGRGRRSFDPAMRCYQCGDRGHFSRDCPDSRYGYKRGGSRERDRDRGERRGRY